MPTRSSFPRRILAAVVLATLANGNAAAQGVPPADSLLVRAMAFRSIGPAQMKIGRAHV